MVGYLTPDTPAPSDFVYRRLRIPNNEQFIANVSGALLELTNENSWTPQGTMTADDAASLSAVMVDEFMLGGNWMTIGSIVPYVAVGVPSHCVACDGATLLRVDYPLLYAALDPVFIVGPDHFTVPDLRGRVPIGEYPAGAPAFMINQEGGEYEHTLSVNELASHAHSDAGHSHTEANTIPVPVPQGVGVPIPSAVGAVGVTGIGFSNIQPVGSGASHNNIQPFTVVRYAIVSE